ncbi:hypothetical protein [Dankookia sp. P2]|uniref:hypothetical protein n=1 Tax=Dankookia sp. P2 TaxID=3423955 RepID=UPI003D67FF0A
MTFGQLPYDVAHLLGGGMLLLSFMLLYQRRVGAVINTLALQGAILAAAAAWQGVVQEAPQLFLTALVALAAKAVLIPSRCAPCCAGSTCTGRWRRPSASAPA